MGALSLPYRTKKPRSSGITSIVDFGIPIGELRHLLNDYHDLIDFAKIGVGTAYVTANLKEKIALYKSAGVKPYVGGTLFEKFYFQNQWEQFLTFLQKHQIETIEISSGVLDIPLAERLQLVKQLSGTFRVLAEIGSKDRSKTMPEAVWVTEMAALLNAGCQYVIAEGRGSGSAGIYDEDGNLRKETIAAILREIEPQQIIFEAPNAKSQVFFINQIGANVNLGNIRPHDVLLLEAERVGLRAETFFDGKVVAK